jgi:hypothetical protein
VLDALIRPAGVGARVVDPERRVRVSERLILGRHVWSLAVRAVRPRFPFTRSFGGLRGGSLVHRGRRLYVKVLGSLGHLDPLFGRPAMLVPST